MAAIPEEVGTVESAFAYQTPRVTRRVKPRSTISFLRIMGEPERTLTPVDILKARKALGAVIRRTPLTRSQGLSDAGGAEVVVKECTFTNWLGTQSQRGRGLTVVHNPNTESPLLELDNFIATPHLGAQTAEAQSRAAEDIASEVLNALNGKPLRWVVT